jgi:hypothetical protein
MMKLVSLVKILLNEMYSKVHIGKYVSDIFPVPIDLKQGDALPPLLFILLQNMPLGRSRKTRLDSN